MNCLGSKICIWLALSTTIACSSHDIYMENVHEGKIEVRTTINRCSFLCEDLETGAAGFMVYILNSSESAMTWVQTNQISRTDCRDRVNKIKKMAKGSDWLYFAGFGQIENGLMSSKAEVNFRGRGSFPLNETTIQISYVANSKGECFDLIQSKPDQCPDREFPLPKSLYPVR